jgi:nicotinamide-nucleotide amidase
MLPSDAAQAAVRLVRARGETFATAESLTGGLVAATVVEIPGVSAAFRGGLVVYATDLKHALAGVPEDLLAERGPVDPDVARALAAGARRQCRADWGLATTGVAGPDPQDGIAPGTVYVAVDGPGDASGGSVLKLELTGDRAAVRTESVTRVLRLFAQRIEAASGRP